MNIAGTIKDAINAYDAIAYEIYVSGCTRNCKGCHSPELQDFSYGEKLDTRKLMDNMHKEEGWFDIISIIGGDLLCQDEYEAIEFVLDLKLEFPNKKFWLFTGADEVPLLWLHLFDVVKYGRYDESQKQNGFPASKNQKIIRKGIDY
jgi:organic radical activating enzyme